MNAPANNQRRLPAPNPNSPVLTRMISDPFFNEQPEAITWTLYADHPLATGMKVVRMFVNHDGVEVYSAPADPSRPCLRNIIPISKVRLTEESMPFTLFAEELTDAETEEDDDDDDEDDPEPEPGESSTVTSGTTSS